ncbi:MAG: phenylalanine--tRNA ligase subunit beta [Candidatus Micrarchaeaceae archaeon]
MPTSVHNKNYLNMLLGFKLNDTELEKLLNGLGMSLEKNGAKEIEVEYQANRPDLISTVGLARAIRYFTGRKRSFNYKLSGYSGIVVNINDNVEKVRPYIACMLVKNVKFTEDSLLDLINSIDKLSETFGRHRRRIAIGLHDAKRIEGNISYGVYPNEQFEALGGETEKYSDILENTEKGKAYAELCKTESGYCALKDSKGAMALIPVINSERTKISESTSELFVDVTGTNRYAVYSAANLLATNFIDMGFNVYSVSIMKRGSKTMLTPSLARQRIEVKLERFSEEIGTHIAFNSVIGLANKMGYEAALRYRNIAFNVPAYRLDIINDQDIIEDIAVAYGYDYIMPLPVVSFQQGSLDPHEETLDTLRSIVTGLGFSELMSDYMTNEKNNFLLMHVSSGNGSYIKIKNAKANTITMLRTWLLPSLLNSMSRSQHDKLPHRLFELDLVFSLQRSTPIEQYHLACAISDDKVDLNEIKSIMYTLLNAVSADAKAEIRPFSSGAFIEGRCGELLVNGKRFGIFGELSPVVLEGFGINAPVIALEIEL